MKRSLFLMLVCFRLYANDFVDEEVDGLHYADRYQDFDESNYCYVVDAHDQNYPNLVINLFNDPPENKTDCSDCENSDSDIGEVVGGKK